MAQDLATVDKMPTTCRFPFDRSGVQCHGLEPKRGVASAADCAASCCADAGCEVWQWCSAAHGRGRGVGCASPGECWAGRAYACTKNTAWEGGSRKLLLTVSVVRCPPHDSNENRAEWQSDPPAALTHRELPGLIGSALLRRHALHARASRANASTPRADLQYVPLSCFGKKVAAAAAHPPPRIGRFTVVGDLCAHHNEKLSEKLCCARQASGSLCVHRGEAFAILSIEAPCASLEWSPPMAHARVRFSVPPNVYAGRYAMRGLQIPYATPYTWNGTSLPDAPPLAQRTALVAMFFSTAGLYNPGAEPLRRILSEQCHAAGPADCLMHGASTLVGNSRSRTALSRAFEDRRSARRLYTRARFCVQPFGDTASRKGFFDALALGCIPVIFSREGYRGLEWLGIQVEELSVVAPFEALYETGTGLLGYLRNLKPRRVAKLHASIRSWRPTMQYAVRPGMADADMVDTLIPRLGEQLLRVKATAYEREPSNFPDWLECPPPSRARKYDRRNKNRIGMGPDFKRGGSKDLNDEILGGIS